MSGIYIHIPFCKTKCGYCDFYSVCRPGAHGPVLDAVLREMELRREYLGGEFPRTLYVGGGTPSLLPAGDYRRIFDAVRRLWGVERLREATIEVNPDDVDEDYFAQLLDAGFNRVSIGMQSFDDEDLRLMNRLHDARGALGAFEAARRAGFGNISIDLIFGIPGSQSWERNVSTAVELSPEHISAYHLTIEPGTPFGRRAAAGEMFPVADAKSERQYLLLHEALSAAGYEHYEISNFARPGLRAVHNSAYWHGEKYLGLGPSAHSYDGTRRDWAVADVDVYLEGMGRGSIYESERLSPRDLYNEFVMTRLRTSDGIMPGELEALFGQERLDGFMSAAADFLRSGLLINDGGVIKIPAEKFLISDRVIAGLFLD